MDATTTAALITDLISDVLQILYIAIPVLLGGVALLIGLFLGVRYAWRWLRRFAK